ncbi:restriction endonuclease [Actinomycetospora sp. TBRC 11914]|uniref:restriction endonuclease n=1 Tax=Actinomycetospora sp. TBRC 11914 TaxID=2729387 RepID=UPI00145CDB09|nr:restriction endonuclease [Actinomycetospora sp. TBRC 11914]NMO93209.1 hypothetical protein [Actinomycetospora sp. TBRC 11914]
MPGLLGGKAVWLPLVLELVRLVGEGRATNLDSAADLSFEISGTEPRSGGAAPKREPATWREYYGFLRGLRLAESTAGGLRLTTCGLSLYSEPTAARLSEIFADRVRLFAETLSMLAHEALTVDEVDDKVRYLYEQTWRSRGNTRIRMDWQEILGLIEGVGNRRWQATEAGRELLSGRIVVTPEAFASGDNDPAEISKAPAEIATILDELRTAARTHESRSTYNIWVPSPPSNPNKVENLRIIVNAAFEKIEREELFSFICQRFDLARSSVNSMLPFMRASGVLSEVGRGVFEATPPARAWIDSGDDLNFIRILHANMRFIGEMIRSVESDVPRKAMYAEAKNYGVNVDKCRWIASFLVDAGLIEESRYGSLRATSLGSALAAELPLADVSPTQMPATDGRHADDGGAHSNKAANLREQLNRLSLEPFTKGQPSGRGLEVAIRDLFHEVGFEARTVGGSGDTDILLQWAGPDGSQSSAIVEAKARSSGSVSHTDISDVGIETHKERHQTHHVAIVGPSFSGDTIKNMAERKQWVLLEADRLGAIAEAAKSIGLRPCEVGVMFQMPNGLTAIEDLLAARGRELAIISFVIAKLVEEANDSKEAISARDISRDGRRTDLSPSVDEVVAAITTLSGLQISALRQVDKADDPKFSTYVVSDVSAGAAQLRALADSIESGAASVANT